MKLKKSQKKRGARPFKQYQELFDLVKIKDALNLSYVQIMEHYPHGDSINNIRSKLKIINGKFEHGCTLRQFEGIKRSILTWRDTIIKGSKE